MMDVKKVIKCRYIGMIMPIDGKKRKLHSYAFSTLLWNIDLDIKERNVTNHKHFQC